MLGASWPRLSKQAPSKTSALVQRWGQAHGNEDIDEVLDQFRVELKPLETGRALQILTDNCTGARYCECHIQAASLIAAGTIDAPLDPESQSEYRANREILGNEFAFIQMKEDALKRRSFSNLVAEYMGDRGGKPLKILGGQHRFEAIRLAHEKGINELHGVKVYFGLDMKQRLDVATISNRNLAISGALLDRMKETYRGTGMRDWCHTVGLLAKGHDFAERPLRGRITVSLVRTFIHNFYLGKEIDTKNFKEMDTTPILYASGKGDDQWEKFLSDHPDVWKDTALVTAGREFATLITAQRQAFVGEKVPSDFPHKATNGAVVSAWAFAAGMFQKNEQRLKRHYSLPQPAKKGQDPLNAKALAKGRHPKVDKDSYRGLGYRVDARERGQMVELFNLIAEDDEPVTSKNITSAIYAWFAKKHTLDFQKQREK